MGTGRRATLRDIGKGRGPGVGGGFDPLVVGIVSRLEAAEGGDPSFHGVAVRQALGEALELEQRKLELLHIQPTAVLGLWWLSDRSAKRLASAGGKAA